jgi:hypothetical protein
MGSRRITCIFCGAKGSPSKEHVIPRWVRAQLATTSDVSIEVNSVAVRRWPNLYVALADQICDGCNSGWLSKLEKAVKPYLAPMLTHQTAVSLDTAQQRDLARWAVIKVLLIELALRQKHGRHRTALGYVPSEVELAWLATNATPPPRSQVLLGAFDADSEVVVSIQARMFETSTAGMPAPAGVPFHVTTLTVGYVLFQVFTIDFVAADSLQFPQADLTMPPPLDEALIQIWPTTRAVIKWPADVYVDRASLPMVVRGYA